MALAGIHRLQGMNLIKQIPEMLYYIIMLNMFGLVLNGDYWVMKAVMLLKAALQIQTFRMMPQFLNLKLIT
jgi:hypothetical protein